MNANCGQNPNNIREPLKYLTLNSLGGRCGLVGLFVTYKSAYGAKGRWFASRLLLFFFVRAHPSSRRKRLQHDATMWTVKTRKRGSGDEEDGRTGRRTWCGYEKGERRFDEKDGEVT